MYRVDAASGGAPTGSLREIFDILLRYHTACELRRGRGGEGGGLLERRYLPGFGNTVTVIGRLGKVTSVLALSLDGSFVNGTCACPSTVTV